MFDILYCILNLAMVIATLWIVKNFLEVFFEKSTNRAFFFWLLFAGFQLFLEYHKGSGSVFNLIINLALVFLITVKGYEKSEKAKLFVVTLLYVVWTLVEIIVYYCLQAVLINQKEFEILGSVTSKIVMIITVCVLSLCWDKKENREISLISYISLLFVSVGSIVIAVCEFYSNKNEANVLSSMIIFSILLLINVIMFEMYSKLAENFRLEKEKLVYVQQMDMISKNMAEQKSMLEDFYREKHNLINELVVLKEGIEQANNQRAVKNLNRIIKTCNVGERILNSGNQTVDAIINFKHAIAKEMGIEFELQVFVPEELPFDECDLGVVLGNALDNAMEATKECQNHEKVVQIYIGIKKNALVAVIKNPYEHLIKTSKSGQLISTKKESSRHGYGVSSISRVAEKYQGEVLFEILDGEFVLMVTMNLGDFVKVS